jgi:hypothetical protein
MHAAGKQLRAQNWHFRPLADRARGSPGTYSAPLKVLVRREADQTTAFEKTYKIEVNSGGAAQAPFQLVTDPILLPLTRKNLSDDYSIFVGFDNGHDTAKERPRGHRKPAQTSSN